MKWIYLLGPVVNHVLNYDFTIIITPPKGWVVSWYKALSFLVENLKFDMLDSEKKEKSGVS